MTKFVAVLPHDNGAFQAREVEITGSTPAELLKAAQRPCTGGRYVSRIMTLLEGCPITVYTEGSGWLVEDPTDQAQLAELAVKASASR